MDGDVLVSVEHDDGVAGIVDHGEFACLSGCLGEAQTVLRGYFSSMEGLTGERSAEGGLLAPGAVGARGFPKWEGTGRQRPGFVASHAAMPRGSQSRSGRSGSMTCPQQIRARHLGEAAHSAQSVCAGAEHKYQYAQRKNPGEHEEAVADERVWRDPVGHGRAAVET